MSTSDDANVGFVNTIVDGQNPCCNNTPTTSSLTIKIDRHEQSIRMLHIFSGMSVLHYSSATENEPIKK